MKANKFGLLFYGIGLLLILLPGFSCCDKDSNSTGTIWPEGNYTKSEIQKLTGFPEQKNALLAAAGMSDNEFISFSTDSAWHLSPTDRNRLKILRNSIEAPATNTLLQKVIPLQDVATYMNNTYGGTVGGFICKAADIKSLSTMGDIYDGLRLDYTGTKFLPNGAGYAVIRFTSNNTDKIYTPYCIEMGGTTTHAWPSTGGGFTSSTLGEGGFPEYTFSNYYAPNQGSELYEITPLGNE
ncbi:MAG: hypothetical protein PHS30_08195, partial [Bacteroidales bacterium]|nr:hypothetical protein [Bacteroidales bacterium]